MHRIHHFDTSEAAYEASLNEWDVREGDVLVIASEQIVGLASTEPIAITIAAGALKTIEPMSRGMLLDELVHGEREIGHAVDEALRHGWPVAPHYLAFASPGRCVTPQQATTGVQFDNVIVAVIVDAIDHRITALTERATTVDPESSQGLFLAQGLAHLKTARSRFRGDTGAD
ncbi:hypothetical protein [Sphingomonas solaris]|uniref:Uncharacterized protein n=1 Tax=Alterirhizorhabdus solaris TaxID=2529389 RepID=A0A558RBZ2_9SPHN|nr:hypothetical protein [Sphingomonas solaris]TVV76977.1 hypothetical protein FOY91_02755 [Sphingomonas solaris]